MCNLDRAEYSTFLGPRSSIQRLEEEWDDLPSVRGVEMSRLQVVRLDRASDDGDEFEDPHTPTVAVAYHGTGGAHLAQRIQVDLLLRFGDAPGILCEPGVDYFPATFGAPGGHRPSIVLDVPNWPDSVYSVASSAAAQRYRARGRRVAVLDTGDQRALNGSMVAVQNVSVARRHGDDTHGHGTAVCDIIRAIRPDSSVEAVQVADRYGRTTSPSVIAALIYVLWPEQGFDVVNISLTTNLGTECSTTIGASLDYVVQTCAEKHGNDLATVVAAAGNDPQKLVAYPALMRNAVVAFATDRSGVLASYNSNASPHHGIRSMEAFGGVAGDSLGIIERDDDAVEEVFGTSFAAPVITAALLP